MKDRGNKPYRSKTLLNCWRSILEDLNRLKVEDGSDLDPESIAGVTDYVLDRIDDYRPADAPDNAGKVMPQNAQFATSENRRDNGPAAGAR